MKFSSYGMLLLGLTILAFQFFPELAFADPYTSGDFVNKTQSLQNALISKVLPLMSVVGLIISGMMMATGNEGSRQKMYVVLIGSIIGLLAPAIIGFIKSIVGG